MTQHTKKWLILAGLGVAGFVLWQRFGQAASRESALNYMSNMFNMGLPTTSGVDDAMAIIDDMLLNNPLQRSYNKTEVTGINPDAPKIYL